MTDKPKNLTTTPTKPEQSQSKPLDLTSFAMVFCAMLLVFILGVYLFSLLAGFERFIIAMHNTGGFGFYLIFSVTISLLVAFVSTKDNDPQA